MLSCFQAANLTQAVAATAAAEPVAADSTFAQWVQKYRAEHSGDCPDDVREFAAQVLPALSFLHEKLVWDYDYKALACGSLVECSSDEDEDEDCGLPAARGVAKGISPTEKSVESNKQLKDSFRSEHVPPVNNANPEVLEPYFCTSSMYF